MPAETIQFHYIGRRWPPRIAPILFEKDRAVEFREVGARRRAMLETTGKVLGNGLLFYSGRSPWLAYGRDSPEEVVGEPGCKLNFPAETGHVSRESSAASPPNLNGPRTRASHVQE